LSLKGLSEIEMLLLVYLLRLIPLYMWKIYLVLNVTIEIPHQLFVLLMGLRVYW